MTCEAKQAMNVKRDAADQDHRHQPSASAKLFFRVRLLQKANCLAETEAHFRSAASPSANDGFWQKQPCWRCPKGDHLEMSPLRWRPARKAELSSEHQYQWSISTAAMGDGGLSLQVISRLSALWGGQNIKPPLQIAYDVYRHVSGQEIIQFVRV
jgi:hypothetical protein